MIYKSPLAVLCFLSVVVQASTPVIVSTGWDLFQGASDARWMALGGAVIGIPSSTGINLANPAQDHHQGRLSFYHQSRFAGLIQEDALSFHIPAFGGQTVSLLREGVNQIPDTRSMLLDWGEDGQPGTGDVGEGNGQLDSGERLDPDKVNFFSQSRWGVYFPRQVTWGSAHLGYAVKALVQSMGDYAGLGFGVDVGWVHSLGNRWSLGAVLSNALTSVQIWDSGRTEVTLPTVGMGLAGTLPLPWQSLTVFISLNSEIRPTIASQSDDFQIGSSGGNLMGGVEVAVKQRLFLRLGRNQVQSLTAGVGLNWTHVVLNYALQLAPPGSDLGQTHLVSFDVETRWLMTTLKSTL